MQKFSLYCTAGFLSLLLIAGIYSCNKSNGINNGQVIETPYSLYFSDTSGTLFYTNDGKNINSIIFPPDGKPSRAICTAGPNILFAKDNLYISYNNGQNFNHSYDSITKRPDVDCKGRVIDLNQSMLFDVPSWRRAYVMSSANPGDGISTNWLGLAHNDTFGVRGHWSLDVYYDTIRTGLLPVTMTSLTQLANGILCGLAYDGDQFHVRNFYKSCEDDATCRWTETTANPDGSSTLPMYNTGGTPLPPTLTGAITTPGYFTLGHLNNRLIAVDSKCSDGAWYSDDTGRNWTQYQGLPTNVSLLCIASPFEQVCLVGTDSAGLYILNTNTNKFELNNNGLASNLKVRSIAFKENIYKNNTTSRYVYIATDQGIFQSTDGGHNWVQTIKGNYVSLY